eukprot:scaffold39251_cov77-Cyclotella_meneghiniana.AAC.4
MQQLGLRTFHCHLAPLLPVSMRQLAVETSADRLYDLIILKSTRTWGNTGRIVLIPVRSRDFPV